ncbi:kinase-like domain-containing protein [Pestalotiopsis sp. NC0098]|nr:kinase-like domain-containing protein [Pestalotiopsis sp. NC0098]
MGDAKDTHEEVNSVQRIVIHPDHSGSETLQGDLALKIFKDSKPRAKKSYKKEVEANRRTPEHERIVPLLAAFEHREDFHVVLPWARGGNLAVFFQKYAAPKAPSKSGQVVVDWATEDWLLAECLGLADGLAAVHGASTSAQIHADIKPENILCFASGGGDLGPFTLKLADFGESLEVDQDDKTIKTEFVPHTKTYRPPEHDTADILDLKYDVWCLGCVFFEFVTWAIAGAEKIDIFSDERLAEHDEKKVTTAMGEIGADTFFKKIAGRPSSRVLSPTNVKYERVTIDKKKLSRSYFRRQYRWWLNYTGTVKALVKTEFTRHVAWLKEQGASEKLEKFLVFIETRMLVVDTKDRADSAEVHKFLGKLCSGPHAQSNGAIT